MLLEAGVGPEEAGTADHLTCPTPGMTAALHGRDAVLRVLLNRGCRPDVMSVPARWTPLMFAAAGYSSTCLCISAFLGVLSVLYPPLPVENSFFSLFYYFSIRIYLRISMTQYFYPRHLEIYVPIMFICIIVNLCPPPRLYIFSL